MQKHIVFFLSYILYLILALWPGFILGLYIHSSLCVFISDSSLCIVKQSGDLIYDGYFAILGILFLWFIIGIIMILKKKKQ